MTDPSSPFEKGLRLMGAQQQLAARSLINMIEMISTSSHRYADTTRSFTQEAMELVREAATTHDPAALSDLQQRWAQTCLKYGQDQTRATMSFVEQCGFQALNATSNAEQPPVEEPAKPTAKPRKTTTTRKKKDD